MNNRITTGVKIAGTGSFRLACSKLFGFFGTNLQNPPDDLLQCIIPDEGYILIQIDQAGAESKVVAYEADYGLYRKLVEAGIKHHIYIALQIFVDKFRDKYPRDRYLNRTPEELKSLPEWKELSQRIKNSKTEYYIGKVTNHARSYRMKWPTFRTFVLQETEGSLVLSAQEAKTFLNTWDRLFPEVVVWQEFIEIQLKRTRTLTNLFGFSRYFHEKMSDNLIREGISWIPQSTVACITHEAAIKATEYIEASGKKWYLLNNKHDSLTFEVPKEELQEALGVLPQMMELNLVSTKGAPFKMGVEVQVGYNWLKRSETNPEGLYDQSR